MHHMFTKQGFRGALRLTLIAAFGVSLVSAGYKSPWININERQFLQYANANLKEVLDEKYPGTSGMRGWSGELLSEQDLVDQKTDLWKAIKKHTEYRICYKGFNFDVKCARPRLWKHIEVKEGKNFVDPCLVLAIDGCDEYLAHKDAQMRRDTNFEKKINAILCRKFMGKLFNDIFRMDKQRLIKKRFTINREVAWIKFHNSPEYRRAARRNYRGPPSLW